jgi:hypothetical protein
VVGRIVVAPSERRRRNFPKDTGDQKQTGEIVLQPVLSASIYTNREFNPCIVGEVT